MAWSDGSRRVVGETAMLPQASSAIRSAALPFAVGLKPPEPTDTSIAFQGVAIPGFKYTDVIGRWVGAAPHVICHAVSAKRVGPCEVGSPSCSRVTET